MCLTCYNIGMSKIRHLIDYFIPDNYQLHLNISKAKRQFSGQVVVTGQPLSHEIRLHAKGLAISQLSTDTNSQPRWRQDSDEIIIDDGNAHQITVSFSGQINETAMNGLYLCKYRLDGKNCELFATQFESHYARQCFPCIDEPAAKATFDISIATDDPDDSIVLSNMPGHLQSDGVWQFDTTPRMSTYLVAFVGGKLVSTSGVTKNGVVVSAYATPAQPTSSLDYALTTAIKSVEFYEDYFGVNYPLPKLDNIALPDFSAGAMENWGLITYRETALLITADSSEASRESVATVIAHEISHQWFGNLVTMNWWNDLWLNESFASLMENTAVDYIYPEYNVWDDYEINDVSAALKRDAMADVQSVQQDVYSPDEIATLFDSAIVYAKGERLLKMLLAYIGEPAFRNGLTSYFKKYQYSNTTADNLWDELSRASGLNIKELMNPWLTRPGYPLVAVSLRDNQLTMRQHEFVIGRNPDQDKTWPIPLFTTSPSLPKLLNTQQHTVTWDNPSQFVMFNANDAAHYITQYSYNLLSNIVNNFDQLGTIDKIKLLRESILLSSADLQDITQTVDLARCAQNETNSAVLSTLSGIIGNLDILVQTDTNDELSLKHFAGQLFSSQFNRLFNDNTSSNRSINDRKALAAVLARSVYGNNQSAINYCLHQYHDHIDNLAAIPGDIRPTVLSSAIKYDDSQVFDDLWQIYQSSQDADLKIDLCAGLTSVISQDRISQLLSYVTNSQLVKPQDVIYFVAWLFANKHARTTTWQWLRDNWPWIRQTFSGDMGYDDFARIAGNNLCSTDELAEYDRFFADVTAKDQVLVRTVRIGHDSIVNRVRWIQRNQPVLGELLKKYQ